MTRLAKIFVVEQVESIGTNQHLYRLCDTEMLLKIGIKVPVARDDHALAAAVSVSVGGRISIVSRIKPLRSGIWRWLVPNAIGEHAAGQRSCPVRQARVNRETWLAGSAAE